MSDKDVYTSCKCYSLCKIVYNIILFLKELLIIEEIDFHFIILKIKNHLIICVRLVH